MDLSQDILRGADEIARFLFGSPDERRRVQRMLASSRVPHFKLGGLLCARRSVLLDWIERQENLTGEGYRMSDDPEDNTPVKFGAKR